MMYVEPLRSLPSLPFCFPVHSTSSDGQCPARLFLSSLSLASGDIQGKVAAGCNKSLSVVLEHFLKKLVPRPVRGGAQQIRATLTGRRVRNAGAPVCVCVASSHVRAAVAV